MEIFLDRLLLGDVSFYDYSYHLNWIDRFKVIKEFENSIISRFSETIAVLLMLLLCRSQ